MPVDLGTPQARQEVLDSTGRIFNSFWIQWFQRIWQIITGELRVDVAALTSSVAKLTPTGYVVAVKFTAALTVHLISGSGAAGGSTYTYAVPGLLTTDDVASVNLTAAAQTDGVGVGNARVSADDTLEVSWTCAAPAGALTRNGDYSIVVFRTPA